jgi:hypothetical protein
MESKKILLSAALSTFLLSVLPTNTQAFTWDDFRAGATRVWSVLTDFYNTAPAIRQSIVAAVGVAANAGFIDSDAAQGVAELSRRADQLRIQISAAGTVVAGAASAIDEAMTGRSTPK